MAVARRSGRIFVYIAPPILGGSICLAATPAFHAGITTGNMSNASVTEASGIVASRMNPNVLWAHEDSGNPAQLYPTTPGGANLGTYTITGAGNTDWEDIAIGPGPVSGTQYLYLGDIGDNNAVRPSVSVYRVVEPTVSDVQSPVSVSVGGMVKFTFAYPDGPRDAESMFVDPLTRDLYIISKRDATKHVYRAAYPQATSGTTTLQLVTELPNANWITAADISPDGSEIIMRAGATNTGLMYVRPSGGTVADALAAAPISIPLLSETQGESIGFDPTGWGYYTTSEGASAPLHYYNRLPGSPGVMYWDTDVTSAGSYVETGAGLGGTGPWNTSTNRWYVASANVAWVNGNNAIFTGTAGAVTLTAPITANGLTFKTSGYVVTGSTLTLNGAVTVDPGVSATIASTLAGTVGLTKVGAGTLTLSTTNSYIGPTTVSAGKLVLGGASDMVLNAGALSVSAGATIDLKDNKIITSSGIGSFAGGAYTGLTGLIASGRNGGTWNGSGIITSQSDALTGYTSIAIATAQETGRPGLPFAGVGVGATDVLVMYTYAGDANLSGNVDVDDYGQIDFNTLAGGVLTGWFNGDFDYSGVVDVDDYGIIDFAVNIQGTPFPTGVGMTVSAVPEGGAIGPVVAVIAVGARRRRGISR